VPTQPPFRCGRAAARNSINFSARSRLDSIFPTAHPCGSVYLLGPPPAKKRGGFRHLRGQPVLFYIPHPHPTRKARCVGCGYFGGSTLRKAFDLLGLCKDNASNRLPTPEVDQKVYRVYSGDAKPGGASWSPVDPGNVPDYRDAAGLPSGGASGVNNTGPFVIEGMLQDTSAVVKTRSALSLDGTSGELPEDIIPHPIDSGAVRIDRVSA